MVLYSDQSGPLIKYESNVLQIEDLNPEMMVCWRLSRWEMFVFGLRAVLASFTS